MSKIKKYISIVAAVMISAALSISVFAGDYYASDESGNTSAPSYIDSINISSEKVDISKANQKNTYQLTPEGNLTLVDDYTQIEESFTSNSENGSKEFLTVTTKSGNTFYIIVDRDGNTENVHFLNMVDEQDLMALLNQDKTECTCSEKCVVGDVNTNCPICKNNMSACSGEEQTTDSEETTKEGTSEGSEKKESKVGIVLLIIVVAGGGFAFYWFKVRNKDNNNQPQNNHHTDDDYNEGSEQESEVNENEQE